ncbi:MAG: zinc metallopeptidase [Geminicoccaceae bacterium]
MIYLIGALLFIALFVGPQLWAKWVIGRYGRDRPDFPGTGGELARHLLDEAGLRKVAVEASPQGDHYDPIAKVVRLRPEHKDGRSLSAVTIAAHEVAHALQDRDGEPLLHRRVTLGRKAVVVERVGSVFVYLAFALGLAARSPAVFALAVLAGILSGLARVVVDLITLPVEYDASFNRALPILDRGDFLPKEDLPAARRLLRACAYTYVSASLVSTVNILRWLRMVR